MHQSNSHPLDDRQIRDNLFFVRKTPMNNTDDPGIHDGMIPVDSDNGDTISVGYRLYIHKADAPVLLFFHGNGEIVTDYDTVAHYYHLCGASLLVVDYRGYGWSDGIPLTSRLLPDADAVFRAIPELLDKHGIQRDVPLFVKGRSLGSAPAIYLAYKYGDAINGLIVESGYADAPSLFRRLDIPLPEKFVADPELPINNLGKIKDVTIPLLVIHGKKDQIIPVMHGQDLHAEAASTEKELLLIDHAGHNNVISANTAAYFDAIKTFIAAYR